MRVTSKNELTSLRGLREGAGIEPNSEVVSIVVAEAAARLTSPVS